MDPHRDFTPIDRWRTARSSTLRAAKAAAEYLHRLLQHAREAGARGLSVR